MCVVAETLSISVNQICVLLRHCCLSPINYPQLSPLIGFLPTKSAYDKHLQADPLRVNRKGDDAFALFGRGMTSLALLVVWHSTALQSNFHFDWPYLSPKQVYSNGLAAGKSQEKHGRTSKCRKFRAGFPINSWLLLHPPGWTLFWCWLPGTFMPCFAPRYLSLRIEVGTYHWGGMLDEWPEPLLQIEPQLIIRIVCYKEGE